MKTSTAATTAFVASIGDVRGGLRTVRSRVLPGAQAVVRHRRPPCSGLLLILPLLPFICLLIKLETPGPSSSSRRGSGTGAACSIATSSGPWPSMPRTQKAELAAPERGHRGGLQDQGRSRGSPGWAAFSAAAAWTSFPSCSTSCGAT